MPSSSFKPGAALSPSNAAVDCVLDTLGPDALNRLMPLHILLDQGGSIRSLGRTLIKVQPSLAGCLGESFFSAFVVRRPDYIDSVGAMFDAEARVLHLSSAEKPEIRFKAVLAPLPDRTGVVLNLSFGISLLETLRAHELTSADFPASDLTVEMLYLLEAKSAAMAESKKLNLRLRNAKDVAEKQAMTDPLTGIGNRRALNAVLDQLTTDQIPFALIRVDLDLFKRVNDTLGHAAGDEVLKHVARLLRETSRTTDLAARVGGDEFVLVCEALTNEQRLTELANGLIARLEEPVAIEGGECRVSASIGIAIADTGQRFAPDDILSDADEALYASKRNGRGCVTFHPSS